MTTSFDKLPQSNQKCEIKGHLLNKSWTGESTSIYLCSLDISFTQRQWFVQLEGNYVFANQNAVEHSLRNIHIKVLPETVTVDQEESE